MAEPITQYVVEIPENAAVHHRVGEFSGSDGTIKFDFHVQQGFVHVGDAFPHPITIRLEAGAAPYSPGRYLLTDFLRLRGGKPEIEKTPKLVPLRAKAQTAS